MQVVADAVLPSLVSGAGDQLKGTSMSMRMRSAA
jgi:hypothetical protein